MLKTTTVPTKFPLISISLSNDSKLVNTVTKNSNYEYWVRQFCLEKFQETFAEKIGGDPKQYIKCKEVEQTVDGQINLVCYNDDGKFYVRIYGR